MRESRRMRAEDALAITHFAMRSYIGISPDGRYVAYTLQEEAGRQPNPHPLYQQFSPRGVSVDVSDCSAWVVETATGLATRLGCEEACSWAPAFSPDGSRVAYYSAEGGVAQIWIHDLQTGLSNRVSERIARPFFAFERVRWSHDGRILLAKLLPEGMTVDEANAQGAPQKVDAGTAALCTAVEFTSRLGAVSEGPEDQAEVFNRYNADLVVLDVQTGAAKTLVPRGRPIWYEFSPDGLHVASTEVQGNSRHCSWQCVHRIVVRSLADGGPVYSADEVPVDFGITISWSPDGSRLAYTTASYNVGETTVQAECRVVDLRSAGHQVVRVEEGVGFSAVYRPPLWAPDGHSLLLRSHPNYWVAKGPDWLAVRIPSPEGYTVADVFPGPGENTYLSPEPATCAVVLARGNHGLETGLYRLEFATGRLHLLTSGETDIGGTGGFGMATSLDGSSCAYIAEDVGHPADLWLSDVTFASRKRVSIVNPQLEGPALGTRMPVEWQNAAGDTLRGLVLLPPRYEANVRYPVIVDVYAGMPWLDRANRYGVAGSPGLSFTDSQLLASHGYVVFMPEVRATGEKMLDGHAASILPGVDRLVEMGIADPDKLGAIGQSHGGFGVLALLVRTTRFRAAVATSSFCDWVALATHSDGDTSLFWLGYSKDHLGAGIWENRERYIDNSPLFFLDRVETPLLLIQGATDETTPPRFAEQAFVGLKSMGKEACYVRYEGESHWAGAWGFANRVDYTNRILDWFDRYLASG